MIHLMTVTKLQCIHWFKFSLLLWPFNLYFPLARQLPEICGLITDASSLFVFRLRQILAQGGGGGGGGDGGTHNQDLNGRNRWERAFRLFCQEVLPSSARQRRNAANESILHQMLLNSPV